MRKDRIYLLEMTLDGSSYDVLSARCGCAAGMGPKASCKHIAALCYALEEFSRLRQLPDFLTCTDKLQSWNQPRPRKLQIIPVESLYDRKHELKPPQVRSRVARVASQCDPRPDNLRADAARACEQLRCSLLALNVPCAFLDILVPTMDKIRHDHNYTLMTCDPVIQSASVPAIPPTSNINTERILTADLLDQAIQCFQVSTANREHIEEVTRGQSTTTEWHHFRARRITSSICGRILIQKKKSLALLTHCLYPKPLREPLPPPIAWGRKYETTACRAYKDEMVSRGRSGLTTYPCGFLIHPTMGWLGASPDAKVLDPSFQPSYGIAEFKCPYSKRDKSPQECCDDPSFYCSWNNGQIQLRHDHQYYHQVLLQLFVCTEFYWCDFCVYTPRGITVQRIFPDKQWQSKHIPELDDYFFGHMLPENYRS